MSANILGACLAVLAVPAAGIGAALILSQCGAQHQAAKDAPVIAHAVVQGQQAEVHAQATIAQAQLQTSERVIHQKASASEQRILSEPQAPSLYLDPGLDRDWRDAISSLRESPPGGSGDVSDVRGPRGG